MVPPQATKKGMCVFPTCVGRKRNNHPLVVATLALSSRLIDQSIIGGGARLKNRFPSLFPFPFSIDCGCGGGSGLCHFNLSHFAPTFQSIPRILHEDLFSIVVVVGKRIYVWSVAEVNFSRFGEILREKRRKVHFRYFNNKL